MTPLEDLRWHWGSAYDISTDAAGRKVAVPRDGTGRVLAASTVRGLRQKIRDDYPVMRARLSRSESASGRQPAAR